MTDTTTTTRPLYEIAAEIRRTWRDKNGRPNVNFAAKPYLDAMAGLDSMSDRYGMDDARGIVAYFLSNASQYKGEDAKRIKAELRRMLGR